MIVSKSKKLPPNAVTRSENLISITSFDGYVKSLPDMDIEPLAIETTSYDWIMHPTSDEAKLESWILIICVG